MQPVAGGTQKVTFNQQEREYESQLRAAEAQASGNPYVNGVGVNYGGSDTEPSQDDAPGNVPNTSPPTEEAQSFTGTDALSERLALMAKGGQNRGLNNRNETYGGYGNG